MTRYTSKDDKLAHSFLTSIRIAFTLGCQKIVLFSHIAKK